MTPVVPDGYTVKYYHSRHVGADGRPTPKGGRTQAIISDSSDNVVCSGYAFCSDKDSFNRKIGRNIALGRALKDLHARV